MKIYFLGASGWFATKLGNTVSAAIHAKNRLVVLDAGDGLFRLSSLMKSLKVSQADIFLSHLHLDHCIGLHTLPLTKKGMRIRLFAHKNYLPALKRLLSHPYTASASEQFSKVSIHPLKNGENRVPYKVLMLPLLHADPCFGFRFSLGGKEIAYCTDTGPCKNIFALSKNADVLITECSLLPKEKPHPRWPHLPPELAAHEAKKAGVSLLVLTHFDSNRYSKPFLKKRAQASAKKIFPNTISANDGMQINV